VYDLTRSQRQPKAVDLLIQHRAGRQYGVITREELLELGCSPRQIYTRTKSGLLLPVRPGVFRLASFEPTWKQSLYGTCCWLGPNVVASHRAAAYVWELGDVSTPQLEVTVEQPRRVKDVRIHTTSTMPRCDTRVKDLIPVTDPTRTVIDCCSVLSEKGAQAVMDDAFAAKLTSVERLQRRIAALSAKGRNGIGVAKKLLDQRVREREMPESRLTRHVLRIIQQSTLPNPVSLPAIMLSNGRTLHPDLGYLEFRIAIEADSRRHHAEEDEGWTIDRWRDNHLQPDGWLVLRFTWKDVVTRPEYIVQRTRAALVARGAIL
jgi:predicted transcriptional regulator of viral defense system